MISQRSAKSISIHLLESMELKCLDKYEDKTVLFQLISMFINFATVLGEYVKIQQKILHKRPDYHSY